MYKIFKVWSLYTGYSFQQVLLNRFLMGVFLVGKIMRIGMFLLFLSLLFNNADSIGAYTKSQIIFFYLSFNLIDTGAQLFFREVYRFRQLVVSGGLDFILLKPISPLVKVLLGGADLMDLLMFIILFIAVVWLGTIQITGNLLTWLNFLFLFINALILSAAFHITVLGLGVITVSIDHLIMIYRDLTALMRIPVDLYIEPLRSLLTFVLPLGIMFTFPPKVLMGLLSWQMFLISFTLGLSTLYLALLFWKYSLRHYQSASS
jgi:ABC-2 type transport system permease protein